MQCFCGANLNLNNAYFSHGETDFIHCSNCDLVIRKKFPSNTELNKIYQDSYSSEKIERSLTNQCSGSYSDLAYFNFINRKVDMHDSVVLDFGCGTGHLVSLLKGSYPKSYGVEFSESARKFSLINYRLSISDSVDTFPDDFFDFVSMIEVIEHLTDLSTLSDVIRKIKPGGSMLVTTPNRGSFRALVEGGNWREAKKKFHLALFNSQSLEYHLKKAGFSDINRTKFSPIQRYGLRFWIYTRITQLLGIGGTLCFICKVPNCKK
jgi:2-polyprenyl-3-methyl-5-hydroxy-6-metoxy-1,4-benzoquinol methylase